MAALGWLAVCSAAVAGLHSQVVYPGMAAGVAGGAGASQVACRLLSGGVCVGGGVRAAAVAVLDSQVVSPVMAAVMVVAAGPSQVACRFFRVCVYDVAAARSSVASRSQPAAAVLSDAAPGPAYMRPEFTSGGNAAKSM